MSVDTKDLEKLLQCPECGDRVERKGKTYQCKGCSRKYNEVDEIPILLPDSLKGGSDISVSGDKEESLARKTQEHYDEDTFRMDEDIRRNYYQDEALTFGRALKRFSKEKDRLRLVVDVGCGIRCVSLKDLSV